MNYDKLDSHNFYLIEFCVAHPYYFGHFRQLNECDEKKFVFDLLDTALPYRLIKNYSSYQFYLVKKEREKKVHRLLLENSPLYWLRNIVT
jgi:hypothetical protein